jgi:WD40 repeat protein
LNCLQTLFNNVVHIPENYLSAMFFDHVNRKLITGSTKLEPWPSYKNIHQSHARMEDSAVVLAIFNDSFHQVVSGSQNGSISLWDVNSSDKIFQFHNAHQEFELTTMCFDNSRRRLITGSRDGVIKMWNFNNGQILRRMLKDSDAEVTDILYVEMVRITSV